MGWEGGDGDLHALLDLELIMDGNIDRVLADFPSLNPVPSAIQSPATEEAAAAGEQEDAAAAAAASAPSVPFRPHFGGVASVSLALGSLLAPSKLAFRPALPASGSAPKAAAAGAQAAPASLPSQKRSVAPVAVAPSSKLGVTVDAAAQAVDGRVQSRARVGFASAFPDFLRLRDSGRAFNKPGSGAALRRACIVWFRNDLRVHDNEALVAASHDSMSIVPVYCFDPRDYGKSSSGFDKTGPYRAQFLLESVGNLRESLRERGSELVVRVGNPEDELSKLAKAVGADACYAHQEVSYEELHAEEKVSSALKEEGVDVKFFWGSTLYHVEDLPFSLEQMPPNYSGFRDQLQNVQVRPVIETPKQLKGLPALRGKISEGEIPTLQQLGLSPAAPPRNGGELGGKAAMVGGEAEALKKLSLFVRDMLPQATGSGSGSGSGATAAASSGTQDASGSSMFVANFSCKISPWLFMGCMSPRRVFADLKEAGGRVVNSVSSDASRPGSADVRLNSLLFELLWRDFFRFITRKYGASKKNLQSSPSEVSSPVPA